MHFTTQLGYNSIVLKSDNENSAKALKDKVQKIRSSLSTAAFLTITRAMEQLSAQTDCAQASKHTP